MELIKIITIVIVFYICMFASSFAADETNKAGKVLPINVYKGAVSINKVAGSIELKDGAAPEVVMKIDVSNNSKDNKNISIGFRSTDSTKMGLKKNAKSSVQLSPVAMYKGQAGKIQMANIDLTLLLDGGLPGEPVSDIDIRIVLPPDTKKIIRSNKELLLVKEGGKNVYYLRENSKYLNHLNIIYTTGPVVLDIKKEISPTTITKGSVDVTLTLKNEGTQTANNILLEDNYDSRDFSAGGDGFTLYKGEENDSRLIWRKMIPSLPAGQVKVVTYKVIANYDVANTKLSAATASIDKELVGVSNKIRLYKQD